MYKIFLTFLLLYYIVFFYYIQDYLFNLFQIITHTFDYLMVNKIFYQILEYYV